MSSLFPVIFDWIFWGYGGKMCGLQRSIDKLETLTLQK
jgi:hypothetical protein